MKNVIDRIFESLDGLTRLGAPRESDAERQAAAARGEAIRLLKRRDKKRRGWRTHWQTFLVVNAGLFLLQVLEHIANARSVAVVAVSWGVGLVLHGLSTRRWLEENRERFDAAERLLGHAPPAAAPAIGTAWSERVERCKQAVAAADAVLGDLELKGANVSEARMQLQAGLVGLEDLARGGERIQHAIESVAPGGAAALEAELAALRQKAAAAGDERLRQAHARNADLLEARKQKLARLEAEVERLRVTLDGYVMLADNVRLDAARLGAGSLGKLAVDLKGPMAELQEQIDLVRAVESELD